MTTTIINLAINFPILHRGLFILKQNKFLKHCEQKLLYLTSSQKSKFIKQKDNVYAVTQVL